MEFSRFFKEIFIRLLSNDNSLSPLYRSYNNSIFKLFIIKIRVLKDALKYYLINFRVRRGAFKSIKSHRDKCLDKLALVIGAGPSAATLDFKLIKQLSSKGQLDVFLVNYLLLDPKFFDLNPRYLVLSDPNSSPSSTYPKSIALWRILNQLEIKIITPMHWHGRYNLRDCRLTQCLHFNDASLEGLSTNTNPLKPRGFAALTVYRAMSIALYFNYKKILISGVDNSNFFKINVTSNNQLIQRPHHAFSNYVEDIDLTKYYTNGIGDYLYDIAEMHLSLRRCFKGKNIINVGLGSEVDSFPKIDLKNAFL
jgi:hypothetical protein